MFKPEDPNNVAGMYSLGHFILFFIAIVIVSLYGYWALESSEEKVRKSFKVLSLVVLFLEIFKIVWNIVTYGFNVDQLDRYLPFYYCSLFIYAFLGIAFGRGKLKRYSEVWLVYGGLIAGISFLLYPSSSLLLYPAYHFLSIHSIVYHSLLVGIVIVLMLKKMVVITPKQDFVPFTIYAVTFMLIALIFNKTLGTNMMFLQRPLALPPLEMLQEFNDTLFQIVMFVGHLFLPFLITALVINLFRKYLGKRA